MYSGNKELYTLVQRAAHEKEDKISSDSLELEELCQRSKFKYQVWLLRHISKEDDFANVSSNLVTKANGNSKITRKKERGKMR